MLSSIDEKIFFTSFISFIEDASYLIISAMYGPIITGSKKLLNSVFE
jgi:hypothetical protein